MRETKIFLDARRSTELWRGDAAVLGGSCAGLEAALALRQRRPDARVCVLEPNANLGREITLEWRPGHPGGAVGKTIRKTCAELGIPNSANPDLVGATLAVDDFVQDHGLAAYVKVQPTRPIFTASGMLRGVEVVGKSGRQLVSAPLLIDATPGRIFSRTLLGLVSRQPLAAGRALYLAGVDDMPSQPIAIPASLGLKDNLAFPSPASWEHEAIVRFALDIAPGESSGDTYAKGLRTAIELAAWLRENVPACAQATLVDISPLAAFTYAPIQDDLASLYPHGIYPLPELDEWSVELTDAKAFAARAMKAQAPFPLPTIDEEDILVSSELEADPAQDLPEIVLPPAPAHMHEGAEVAVAGFGVAGAFAAAAAAQEGMQVTVLDPASMPGAIATIGRVHSYYHGLPGGLQDKVDELTDQCAARVSSRVRGYHPMARAEVLMKEMLADNRCTILPEHTVFGVIKDDNRVCALLSAADDGYHVFPCQAAIDATGDGDVAAAAGAPTTLGREGDSAPQPYSYTPSLIREGNILHHHNFDAGWVDPTDTTEFSRGHFDGRRTIRDMGPFTQESHYCTIGSIIGLRESRFLIGRENINFNDFMEGRVWDDAVCSSSAHHDNHAMDYAEESRWAWEHVIMFGLWHYACHGQIPYGALVPQEVDGLLVTGRAIAVDHDLHQLVRMQRDMQVLGEVSGVAAAEAIKGSVMVADVDIKTLQSNLAERGVKPLEPRKAMDCSTTELLAALTCDETDDHAKKMQRGLAMWRLSKMKGEAGAFWPGFFQTATGQARFAGAVAAALGGHDLPAVRQCLSEVLAARTTEPRLGIKAAAPFLVAALALAEIKGADAAGDLAELLAEWKPGDVLTPPDLLLIIKALGQTGNREVAAPAIRNFLAKWPDEPFAIPLWGVRADQSATSFRHTVIIRAARSLIALGDKSAAELILPYMKDRRLIVRRWARKVYAEGQK
ncbi:MAG: FAD-dependent oxidoreductase [Lentisphaerae bacterium]|jgi:hypothetical protein|nr:FAD-dependent oxidoreductase [Lentisphaerota bacterium]